MMWVVLASGCLAYGLLFYKFLIQWRLIDASEPVKGSDLILVGLCWLVLLVQLASIFCPANYYLALIWLAGAALVAIRSSSLMGTYIRRFSGQQQQIPVFWLIVTVVVVYSTLEPANVDSGLYHLPSIRWYERFRVIPGLGNLHGRLAFNSSFFVTSAVFGLTDVVGQTLFPLNGFVYLVVCWRLLGQMRVASSPRFLALILLVLLLFYHIRQVFSPTPDLWATLLPITVFMIWLDLKPFFSLRHVLLFMLICLCVTVKLATIPIALCLLPLGRRVWQQLGSRYWLMLGGFGFVMVVPWLVRTTILSGYLLYPYPDLDLFSFDWKIPVERVRFEKDFVAFWAKFRILEPYFDRSLLQTPAWEWIPAWWQHKEYYFLNKPTWLLAVLSPLIVISHLRQPARRQRFLPYSLPYLVALIGFLFWFLSAPEFRFGYAYIWMSAFLPLLPFAPPKTTSWKLMPWSNGILVMLLCILFGYYGYTYLWKEKFPLQKRLVLPQPLSYRNRGSEGQMFNQNRTRSGLTVLIPTHGPLVQSCYDQERPCSPYFYPDLELRGATVADGFRSSLHQTK
ncbi:membrane protein [Larkinella harenae]